METAEQVVEELFEEAAVAAPALREYPDALINRYHAEGVIIDPDAVRGNLKGGISILWNLMGDNIVYLVAGFEADLAASLEHFGERVGLQHSLLCVPDEDQGTSMLAHFVACLAMNSYTTELVAIYNETGEGEDDEFDVNSGWPVKVDQLAVMGHIEMVLNCIPFDATSEARVRAYSYRWLAEIIMHLTPPSKKSKYH